MCTEEAADCAPNGDWLCTEEAAIVHLEAIGGAPKRWLCCTEKEPTACCEGQMTVHREGWLAVHRKGRLTVHHGSGWLCVPQGAAGCAPHGGG